MSNELKVAIEAAKVGAKTALKYFRKNISVEVKQTGGIVTVADRKTEQAIKQYILSYFPNAKFVGEEFGGDLTEKEFWLIDPIDGSREYARGIGLWGVLVSYVRNEKPLLGVTYLPSFDQLLYAETGSGAYENGESISVSKVGSLRDSYITHGIFKYVSPKLEGLQKLSTAVARLGGESALLGYHLVAKGKIEATIDAGISAWDIAPIKVIVEEAGGRVTNFEGKEWSLSDKDCIVSNGLIHDEVIRILSQ